MGKLGQHLYRKHQLERRYHFVAELIRTISQDMNWLIDTFALCFRFSDKCTNSPPVIASEHDVAFRTLVKLAGHSFKCEGYF